MRCTCYKWIGLFISSLLFLFLFSIKAYANDGALGMTPDGVYAVNHNDLVMVSETIRVKLDSRQVLCEFEFKNTGKEQDVLMGFPAMAMEVPDGFTTQADLTIRNFKAWTQWGPIKVFKRGYTSSSLQDMRHYNIYKEWYCFYVRFKENETKRIYHSYDLSFSFDSTGHVSAGYIIRTGALWKGNLGHSKVIFDFESMPVFALEHFNPNKGYRFEGNTLVWEKRDYEPEANLSIGFNSFRYTDEYLKLADEYGYGPMEEDRLGKISLFQSPLEKLYQFRPDYVRQYYQYAVRKPVEALYLQQVLNITNADLNMQVSEPGLETRDDFAAFILNAINDNNIPVLAKYYDSVYGEASDDEIDSLVEGLKLYHNYFRWGDLVKYEFVKELDTQYDTPNTKGYQYFFIGHYGDKRDIIIKQYEDKGKVTFKYYEPLLFYGPRVVAEVETYIEAIKTGNTAYLFDHFLIKDDPTKLPFADPNHDREDEKIVEDLLKKYEKTFLTNTMRLVMTGVAGVCDVQGLKIEFSIDGYSHKNRYVNHIIHGVYEFPMWGVRDEWLEKE